VVEVTIDYRRRSAWKETWTWLFQIDQRLDLEANAHAVRQPPLETPAFGSVTNEAALTFHICLKGPKTK
jgi:hypothetical protein